MDIIAAKDIRIALREVDERSALEQHMITITKHILDASGSGHTCLGLEIRAEEKEALATISFLRDLGYIVFEGGKHLKAPVYRVLVVWGGAEPREEE